MEKLRLTYWLGAFKCLSVGKLAEEKSRVHISDSDCGGNTRQASSNSSV